MSRRRFLFLASALLVVAIAIVTWQVIEAARSVERTRATVEGAGGVSLDATLLVPTSATAQEPAPAVLVAHGLGGDQADVRQLARTLARAGYVVRTWASRGSGESGGRVGIAAPDGEAADVSALVDELATHPQVRRDGDGDPRVAVIGISQGGGVALMAAAADHRIDAVVPIFAWSSLVDALEPDGVLKLQWASTLFAAGQGAGRTPGPCGRLEQELCDAWVASSAVGRLTLEARRLLDERSPATVAHAIDAPTLVVQGQFDSLFDLGQAEQLVAGLERARTTHRVEWLRGGHDQPLDQEGRDYLDRVVLRWLERHLEGGDVDTGPRMTIELGARRGFAHAPTVPVETASRAVRVTPDDAIDGAGRIRIVNPPSGLPAAVTSLPGLGDMTRSALADSRPANQRARFLSAPMPEGIEVIGAPRIRLELAGSRRDAVVFAHLVDVSPGGQVQVPRGLVTPVRLDDLPAIGDARGAEVEVELPPVAWRVAPGHRIGIDVVTTDAGFAADPTPATLAVRVVDASRGLRLPVTRTPLRTDSTFEAAPSWQRSLALAAALLLVAIAAAFAAWRRRRRRTDRVQEPGLRDTPLRADGLVKQYGHVGRRAVDGVDLRVDPGTVVGLVGPNGAGKTTVIRMLLGLVRATDGTAHLFGQRVAAGIPMLRRTGVLVEGPGLLTWGTGRQHLRRYASATGRPGTAADIDAALEAVDLHRDADRRVGTWSHGMRQRLGIAQALLGRPDIVVLDEPTNGLDPAQIRHLRGLIREVAADGRSVLVSSHLLDELERVCTHVVLMAEGRVLASGTLADVVGAHPDLEHAFLAHTSGGRDDA